MLFGPERGPGRWASRDSRAGARRCSGPAASSAPGSAWNFSGSGNAYLRSGVGGIDLVGVDETVEQDPSVFPPRRDLVVASEPPSHCRLPIAVPGTRARTPCADGLPFDLMADKSPKKSNSKKPGKTLEGEARRQAGQARRQASRHQRLVRFPTSERHGRAPSACTVRAVPNATTPFRRRRTALFAFALSASAFIAPLSSWSASGAAGTTPQTITFGTLPDRTLADPGLQVAATASSGLTVQFTSKTTATCTTSGVNGSIISPAAEGICTVQADQAGDVTFAAATPVQQSFNITKAAQTISFPPLADVSLGQLAVTVTATASPTGFAVVFTTTTPTVCTAGGTHGATITLVGGGTCTVQADQPGNAIFAAAPSVQQSFGVGRTSQAITFAPLTDTSILQSPVSVSASSSALLTVVFSTTTPNVCTSGGTNGATITLIAAGSCTVEADQPGNATFNAATPVQRSFNVTRAQQAISFTALSPRTMLQSPVAVSATASSGLDVTFSTTTPGVCTSGGTNGARITLVAAGLCTVQADQAGNATFAAAPLAQQNFTVTKIDQTITFNAVADRSVLQSPFTVAATASSALTVTFSTSTPTVCTTSGGAVTLLTPGVCTVQADQAGNTTYNPAPSVGQSFTVTKADQTITFGPLGNVPVGPAITVSGTASSGLDVVFSTTTPTVCTASGTNGTTITPIAFGTCTVQADQAGNTTYNAAPSVLQSFGVGKTDQTITFGALATAPVTQAPITVAATASSGLVVTFSTSTPSVCTSSGSNGATITIVSAGTCRVSADQAGNGAFNPAATVTQSFTVAKIAQTITFAALAGQKLGHAPITVTAGASSHLAVTFTTATPAVCQTSGAGGTKVALLTAGTCTIRADQAGDATFLAAPTVSRSFVVSNVVVAKPRSGYWMLGADGHVYAFGDAPDLGSTASPAVAFAARSDGTGYWVVDTAGNVHAFGTAAIRGSRPVLAQNEVVSTISGTPSGDGYWLFTNRGRVFVYGDAHFFGDMSAVQLNGPIVASIATPTGRGYYLVGSDGGVFSFGDARFHGSMGGAHLNQPIVGLSPTPDNHGYWLVASDGGVFAFGAPFRGSLGNVALNKPVNGLVAYGNGYLMVASDGGVFSFSNKAFVGSLGGNPPAAPIVGIAAFTTP